MSVCSMLKRFLALVLLSALGGPGCQPPPEWEYVKPEPQLTRTYQVTLPTTGWRSLEMEGADVAMEPASGGAAFAIFTPYRMKKEVLPLETLGIQLLIEIKDKKVISRERLTLGGQPALRTLLEGKVEGEVVRIESYVITKGEWVYDIIYWGRPEEFQVHYEAFQRVMESFRFIESASGGPEEK